MSFGGRSNIHTRWGRREPGADSQNPAKPGRKFWKTDKNRLNKKAHRWYASFCFCLTFRFNFRTFRSGSVARFVLRIIITWLSDGQTIIGIYVLWQTTFSIINPRLLAGGIRHRYIQKNLLNILRVIVRAFGSVWFIRLAMGRKCVATMKSERRKVQVPPS